MYRPTLWRQALGLGLLMTLVVFALSACGEERGGGGGQEATQKSESGGSGATNGQIVFRRFFDPDQTEGALFTMTPDGSHIRQITHPPKGLPQDDYAEWAPAGQRTVFQPAPPAPRPSRRQ